MPYEVKQQQTKPNISAILASNGAKVLAQNLQLSKDQIMKANSAALRLASDSKLKNCDPYSILKYVYETARYNFSRDDCCYPVPYGSTIQTQIGYKGFRELALQSGEYEDIKYAIVYDCDHISRDKITGEIKVEFEEDYTKTINAKVVGYYAFALKKGTNEVCNSVFWTKEQCEKHGHSYSKTYDSIWGNNEYSFNKMALKTVVKQLTNELKMTPKLEQALKQDGYVYGQGYADNPKAHEKVISEVDEMFDKALTEETEVEVVDPNTGEIVEEEVSPEMLATADLREQIKAKKGGE